MKGDLNTLKKVCMYASKVMFAGQVVLGLIIAATVILGAVSLLSDGFADEVSGWIGGDMSPIASMEALLILVMGFITLRIVCGFMDSIQRNHSPFTQGNVDRLKALSWTYLVSSVFLAVLEYLAHGSVSNAIFLCLGSLLVCVVMYCLALIFRYGGLLQKESDETL